MAANALTGRLQDVTKAVSSLPEFSAFRSMIDLGGGHGLYAMALARLNPELHAIVFDLPEGWRERRAHHVTHHACLPTCEAKVVASQHDREVYPRLVEPAMLFFPPGTTPEMREAVRKILAEG